ncbi:MAG: WG repeat-containing protein [Deltaproteobacteria bacterium]|nr:WG repeat-containing protein [Deltaproteobacteria bacterium]
MRRFMLLVIILLSMISYACASVQKDAGVKAPKERKPFVALHEFSEGLAAVQKEGETGFIDPDGKLVLKVLFHDARKFSEGLAAIQVETKWGYIDKKGRYVINPLFDGAGDFSEGLAQVQKGNRWGYVDKKGKVTIDYLFDEVKEFSQGLAPVKLNGKWGFIKKNGKYAIKPIYNDTGLFTEGLAPVRTDAKENTWGYINSSGKMVIPAQFDEAGSFSGGLAPVLDDTKWGYIDKKVKFVINPQYAAALPFADGLAAVRAGQKWGYINTEGKNAIQPQFLGAVSFSGGYALVSTDGFNWVYINKKGEKAIESAGTFVGNWSPPDIRLGMCQDLVTIHRPYAIYNLTFNTLRVEADTSSKYFSQFNNLVIYPHTSYTTGWPTEHPKALYNGFLHFSIVDENKRNLWKFRVWMFTWTRTDPYPITVCAGLTLLPDPDFGQTSLDKFWGDPLGDSVMFDRGVKIRGTKFKAYLSTAVEAGGPIYWRAPIAIMVLPTDVPMPKPYSD